ncbi:MAG: flagellar type III secretion system protein FliQ [Candidatus Eisenbacteria bacterium]|nr:flagellar type III secretion system protein FliQ [Candidatus Eisenbacteria bacterium]
MNGQLAVDLVRQAVMLSLAVAAPLLLTALLVGVLVSLVQAVTQLQEQTLTFIPKLLALALVFVLTLPWTLTRLVEYLAGVIRSLPTLVA